MLSLEIENEKHNNMKKQIRTLLVAIVALGLSSACSTNENFDENGKIAQAFEQRRNVVGGNYFDVFEILDGQRMQAMQFMYAYMPLPDIADYPAEYHLQNVDYALKARAEMPWGATVPVREFLHFVLPVRVNK